MIRRTRRLKSRNSKGLFSQRSMRRWHRLSGLAVIVFLILVTLTGVLINHANDLRLDKQGVEQGWLLDIYGIGVPGRVEVYSNQEQLVILTDDQAWLGNQLLLENKQDLLAAIGTQLGWFIAGERALFWFDENGRLLDKFDELSGTPLPIEKLGLDEQQQLWLFSQGKAYRSDEAMLDWQQLPVQNNVQWAQPAGQINLNEAVIRIRSRHLTWQRVLLDLHSGRIFGDATIWLWDFFALLILLMSASGLWIWLKSKK